MMQWQEKTDEADFIVPDDVVDLSFRIDCAQLPPDHAWLLYRALERALPWLQQEPRAAVHSIFGAASGNGWVRPADVPGELLQLSRRTRLSLRLPKHRVAEAAGLSGQVLDIGGYPISVGEGRVRLLAASPTIFARSVVSGRNARSEQDDDEQDGDEAEFSRMILDGLAAMNIRAPKLLCGLAHSISAADGCLSARSVMLADLELKESIRIQQNGLGAELKIGCGIFLPHKSIAAVSADITQMRPVARMIT